MSPAPYRSPLSAYPSPIWTPTHILTHLPAHASARIMHYRNISQTGAAQMHEHRVTGAFLRSQRLRAVMPVMRDARDARLRGGCAGLASPVQL